MTGKTFSFGTFTSREAGWHTTVTLDGGTFSVWNRDEVDSNVFWPEMTIPSNEFFDGAKMGQKIEAYTLLADGQPVLTNCVSPVKCRKGVQLQITDRFYGQEYLIPWTLLGKKLLAKQPLLEESE